MELNIYKLSDNSILIRRIDKCDYMYKAYNMYVGEKEIFEKIIGRAVEYLQNEEYENIVINDFCFVKDLTLELCKKLKKIRDIKINYMDISKKLSKFNIFTTRNEYLTLKREKCFKSEMQKYRFVGIRLIKDIKEEELSVINV